MKKVIIIGLVVFELAVVVFLAGKIYLERFQVLGESDNINPISKDDIVFPNQSSEADLKYFYEPGPDKIIDNKPLWLSPDYSYAITINSDSLNERFNYPVEKNPDVFRVVAMGDSFTYGLYVSTEDNYPERLEKMLNDRFICESDKKFEVINLGYGGYDIEYSVERFRVRGQKYDPDLVLWLIKDDDFFAPKELVFPKEEKIKNEIEKDKSLLADYYEKGNFYPWVAKAAQEVFATMFLNIIQTCR